MKVLVCGGRAYDARSTLYSALQALYDAREPHEPFMVIHGEASGADMLADEWASGVGAQVVRCPANWNLFGKAAGPLRNEAMLELIPDLVLAFPGGPGTRDMVARALKAGVPVKTVP